MKSPSFLLQCLQIFSITILLAVSSVAAIQRRTPRLSTIRGVTLKHPEILSAPLSEDLQTFYYNQTLDHFNYKPQSYIKFKQRYVMNFKYWGGPNAPILAYLGAEESIDDDLRVVGFLNDNARGFKALQIYIEHRYYGQSIPFGSREEAMRNASTFGYFNSAQAIADYAEILLHIKKKLHAQQSPVIVIGASYGGMLAAWFRLKYPHIAVGALASSAPILYFLNIKLTPPGGYYSVVSNDFKTCSEMVMPFEIRNDTMFPSKPFDLKRFEDGCMSTYGVRPRPHWVTSYYGGNDIKLVLRRFGSNIIFSNGLKDPFSSGGVLENLSESLLAVSTKNGFHCLDIIISSESDPKWLVEQRSMEVKIIKRWLAKYYRDPKALTKL
ncbi:hypothetical protein SLEP1_g27232 [Rubroshorea leprosula]|uniref:Lysosomal Pro-X carboxypeptidase n=1 Tax=Rubroshorea leprosula TaxID=152421 RepID=A0AAV5JZ13_9ROSI|nr:hypothetical protein SLEP1_g27232 [Rubroshorea leprosula]